MSLNPRAIAVHGLGFAALLVAVQGFAPASAEAVPTATIRVEAVPREIEHGDAGRFVVHADVRRFLVAPAEYLTGTVSFRPVARMIVMPEQSPTDINMPRRLKPLEVNRD